MKINLVYFSATHTTKRISTEIANNIGDEVIEYNIFNKHLTEDVIIPSNEVLVIGMPVYAGRIPALCVADLQRFKGNNTPVVIVGVYGNREFDDALVEMQDIAEDNGFKVIAAGAFIAQHSIFPKVGIDRPDTGDFAKITGFAVRCKEILTEIKDFSQLSKIKIKGNRPYKTPGSIPIIPTGGSDCSACGVCAANCPVGAISKDNPRKTDDTKCIHCGRCIVDCPSKARKYRGLVYKAANLKFTTSYKERKEPETFF